MVSICLLLNLTIILLIQPIEATLPGSNGKIAFSSEEDWDYEIYVMNPDGTGKRQLTFNTVDDNSTSWSYGTKILFISGQDGNPNIYAINWDGTGLTQLTDDPASDTDPSWSPAGSKIVFVSDRDGDSNIYIMNADGSDEKPLTGTPSDDYSPSWSPDGSKIVFWIGSDSTEQIFVMNADGSDQKPLTTGYWPSWSPEGSKIAFMRGTLISSTLYVINADGTGETQLTPVPAKYFGDWSPDGTKIVFYHRYGGISVINADGTNEIQLSSDGYHPIWSPDGSKILFDDNGVCVMNTDGSELTQLTPRGTFTRDYSWQPIPRIILPPSSLARNPLGRVYFIFNDQKYYITNKAAFDSYGLDWDDVLPTDVMNPDDYPSSQLSHDYLLDGQMPLPNENYIAGDVNDGSLYWIPYYTWIGEKYPITSMNAFYSYGFDESMIRYGDPAIALPTSSYLLDGVNELPSILIPPFDIALNPLGRVYFIFNGFKYYFTDPAAFFSYGFYWDDIDPTVNPDDYPSAQINYDYLLEDSSSIFRKPLPNQPYIVGDVNDGSLYWIPYYTYDGEKYYITDMNAFNSYGFTSDMIRFGDPGINLPTSNYLLDGINPKPNLQQE